MYGADANFDKSPFVNMLSTISLIAFLFFTLANNSKTLVSTFLKEGMSLNLAILSFSTKASKKSSPHLDLSTSSAVLPNINFLASFPFLPSDILFNALPIVLGFFIRKSSTAALETIFCPAVFTPEP